MEHPSCAHCTRPSPTRVPYKWGKRTVHVCPPCAEALSGQGPGQGSTSSDSNNYARSSRHGNLDWIERHWYE